MDWLSVFLVIGHLSWVNWFCLVGNCFSMFSIRIYLWKLLLGELLFSYNLLFPGGIIILVSSDTTLCLKIFGFMLGYDVSTSSKWGLVSLDFSRWPSFVLL